MKKTERSTLLIQISFSFVRFVSANQPSLTFRTSRPKSNNENESRICKEFYHFTFRQRKQRFLVTTQVFQQVSFMTL